MRAEGEMGRALVVCLDASNRAQEVEGIDTGVVLGDADLAERAEIARNLYRRITPGDGELMQDAGTWAAAWEEFGAAWDAAAALADEIPPYYVHSGPSDSAEAGGRGTPPTVWRDEACPSLPERRESHSHARVADEPETLLNDTDAVGFVFTSPKCHLGGNPGAPQQEDEP